MISLLAVLRLSGAVYSLHVNRRRQGLRTSSAETRKKKEGTTLPATNEVGFAFFFRCETFDSMIFLLPEVGCLRKVMFSKPDKIVSEYVLLDTCLRLKNGWDGVLALKRNRRA